MSVRDLLAAHRTADRESLVRLAEGLAVQVRPVDPLPVDPVAVWLAVEDRPAVQVDSWQEVRAAVDSGMLTEAEYAFLTTAVDALTRGS